jgi:hypothetical protein
VLSSSGELTNLVSQSWAYGAKAKAEKMGDRYNWNNSRVLTAVMLLASALMLSFSVSVVKDVAESADVDMPWLQSRSTTAFVSFLSAILFATGVLFAFSSRGYEFAQREVGEIHDHVMAGAGSAEATLHRITNDFQTATKNAFNKAAADIRELEARAQAKVEELNLKQNTKEGLHKAENYAAEKAGDASRYARDTMGGAKEQAAEVKEDTRKRTGL